MIEYYINIAYTPSHITLTKEEDGEKELSPQTEAIAFLMLAAGIQRIQDKSACYEFLSRVAILLKHQNVIDSFFKEDVLFVIHGTSYKYKVTMKDIEMHLGIEVSNAPEDLTPRKDWLKNIKKYWKTACIIGVIEDNPMVEKTAISKNVYEIGARPDKNMSTEYLKIVDLFAREAIKSIPEKSFEELQFRVAEVRQNLADYRKKLTKKPRHKFNYAKIPQHVKAKICDTCFGKMKDKEAMYIEPMFVNLCYLAWLWANGYIYIYDIEWDGKHSHTAEVDPRMPFRYEEFDGLNSLEFGINIFDTYHDFCLDKVSHLLKEKK